VLHKVLCCARETGEKAAEIVTDTQCDGLPRPEERELCNLELCPLRSKRPHGPQEQRWGRVVVREDVWCDLGDGSGLVNGAELALPYLLLDWKAIGV